MKKAYIIILGIIFTVYLPFKIAQAQYLSIGIQGGGSVPVDGPFDGGPNFGIEFENFFNKYIGIGIGFNYVTYSGTQHEYDYYYGYDYDYDIELIQMPLLTHFKFRIPFTQFRNGGHIAMGGLIGAGIAFVKRTYPPYYYGHNPGGISEVYYEDETYTSEEFSMTGGFNFETKFNRFLGLVLTTRFTFVEEFEDGSFDFLLGFHFYFGKNPVDPYDGFF